MASTVAAAHNTAAGSSRRDFSPYPVAAFSSSATPFSSNSDNGDGDRSSAALSPSIISTALSSTNQEDKERYSSTTNTIFTTDTVEEEPDMISQEIQAFIDKLQSITPKTAQDDKIVEQVLEESWELLQQHFQAQQQLQSDTSTSQIQAQQSAATIAALLTSMQHLLDSWIAMHLQLVTRPQTSRPFQIGLGAWNMASSQPPQQSAHDANNATNATPIRLASPASQSGQIMQRWYELLGGSLDLTPSMDHYHSVLTTQANMSTNLAAVAVSANASNSNADQRRRNIRRLKTLGRRSWDIVDQLRSWGYTWTPTLETNALLVRCLSRVIIGMGSSGTTSETTANTWNRLIDIMNYQIHPPTSSSSSSSRDHKQQRQAASNSSSTNSREAFYRQQALCDALVAAKHVMSAIRNNPTASSLHIDANQTNAIASWGAALVDSLQNNPASALDFGEEHLLPYDASHYTATSDPSLLSSAYRTLTAGCEAWQFLLCHFAPHMMARNNHQQQQQQQPLLVASAIHDVLDCLEETGRQRYALEDESSGSNAIYVALLRHYLLTIKAWEAELPYLRDNDKEQAIQRRLGLLQRWEDHHNALLLANSIQGDAVLSIPTIQTTNLQRVAHKNMLNQSFNNLMMAKFEVGQVDDVYSLFQRMKDYGLQPDDVSYSAILKAFADSTRPNAAVTAHKLWEMLVSDWRANPASEATVKPKSQHYVSVMVGWSRSPPPRQVEAVKKSKEVFDQLFLDYKLDMDLSKGNPTIKPAMVHNATMLTTLTRCRQRSEEIDSMTLQLVADQLGKGSHQITEGWYHTAMNALSKVGTPEAARIAESFLDHMGDQYRETGDLTMKPTVKHFGYCMNAWSRSAAKGKGPAADAYMNIDKLLDRLQAQFSASCNDPSLLPGGRIYYMLLNALIRTGECDIGAKANEILQRMEELATIGEAEYPSEFVYNKVIEAHRNGQGDDCGKQAEEVLDKMLAAYSHKDTTGTKPTAYSYTGVIQAWSRSQQPDKVVRAEALLKQLQQLFELQGDLDLQPTSQTFESVLNCCAYLPRSADPQYRKEGLRISLQTMVDMESQGGVVTAYAYFLALKTCYDNTSSTQERVECASVLFDRCCKQGMISDGFIDMLRLCAPHLYKQIPSSLPKIWTKNAKTSRHLRGE